MKSPAIKNVGLLYSPHDRFLYFIENSCFLRGFFIPLHSVFGEVAQVVRAQDSYPPRRTGLQVSL